jgi:hypothetical protein
MSKDGFNAEDISNTFARFDDKRRNIVCDESKLERKKPEPMEFSSATRECGGAVLSTIASILHKTSEQRKKEDEEWSEQWDKQREEWEEQDRQFYW